MSFLDSLAATLQKFVTPVNVTFMLKAAGISVAIAVAALFFGTVLGVLGAAGRISKNKLVHGLATLYVEVIRGTPMMLQILFVTHFTQKKEPRQALQQILETTMNIW